MADIEMENGSEVKSEQVTAQTNGGGQAMEATAQDNQDNGSASKYQGNENYQMYLSKQLNPKASEKLAQLCELLSLSTEDFDERAVELLATFSADQANYILDQLLESEMYGVQNKPQYLMSVMRNFKERVRTLGSQQAINIPLVPGPKVASIKSIIDRTGYQLEVTAGQRKFHCPPDGDGQDHSAAINQSSGACIYVGQIPRGMYEDGIIPLFEKIGKIYDVRLMMDPQNGKCKGYAFVTYFDKNHAAEAAKQYDGYEIQSGKTLKVNVNRENTRLFIGNIPKSKSKEEIMEELKKHTEGIQDVIIYANPDGNDGGRGRKNRGFCFVDFNDHKAASDAKRRISQGKVRPWDNDLVVDWAEQQDEPDEATMATVKVLYVKNVKENVTEEALKELFGQHGEVDRAKKMRDFAFIHFKDRAGALAAMEAMKGTMLEGVELDISLAKPQGDMQQKKKLALKRGGPMPYGAMSGGPRGGRGGHYQSDPYFSGYSAPGRRGGGGGGGGGGGYGQQAQQYSGYYPQDNNYGGYGGGPAAGGGYGGGYAAAGGYDMGYAAGAYDPYYGASAYGAPTPSRGTGGSGYGRGSGRGGRASGYGGGAGAGGRGGGFRGGRGAGGRGGAKRPGGDFGGPNPKRGGPRNDDFSADIGPMNMF